jgi:hypothetical protein
MNVKIDNQVNNLAYHLWLSAGREYQRAVDFWIMAEQMVWELATASARLSGSAVELGAAIERTAPAIASSYLQRIQELAYFMWEASGAQCGRALDYWIAAERHVTTMMVVSGEMATSATGEESGGPDDFSAETYLNEIRTGAYYMWEKAGREHSGDHLGFWLAAERQVLDRIEADARTQFCAVATRSTHHRPPQPGTHAPLSAYVPDPQETAPAPASQSSPLRIRRVEPPQGSPRTH